MINQVLKVQGVVHFELDFDSVMVTEDDLDFGDKRLLIAKPAIVLPVGVPVKILVTSEDVLHS
jgi:cytochrome c oxidase subunit 2